MRLIDADVLKEDLTRFYDGEVTARQLIDAQPTVQPAPPEPCEDAVSRQVAIDALWKALYEYEDETEKQFQESEDLDVGDWIGHRIFVQNMSDIDRQTILNLPSAQPATNCSEFPNGSDDTISRKAAIEALARMMPRSYTPDGSHPGDEEIFRAQEVFADCIEALEILPSAQPATNCSEFPNGSDDTISRKAAIEALARMMPRSYTPDGSHPGDEEIFRAQEVFADCIEALEILPSAQPATNCSEFPNGSDDTISRQAALKKLAVYIHLIDKTMGKGLLTDDDCMEAAKSVLGEDELPAAQPEIIRCKNCKYMIDTGDDLMCDNAKGWVVATTSDFGCVLAERRTDEE